MYTFKSKAAADLLMFKATGDELLRLIGYTIPSTQGIVPAAALADALQALEQAIAADERKPAVAPSSETHAADPEKAPEPSISLRQRAWPLMELMKRSLAEGEPVVWGV